MSTRSVIIAIFGLAGVLTASESDVNGDSLLSLVPENAQAAVLVDDLARAYDYCVGARSETGEGTETTARSLKRPETQEDGLMKRFAVETRQLVKAVSGGSLVRAALIGSDGQKAELMIGEVTDSEAGRFLLEEAKHRLEQDGAQLQAIREGSTEGFLADRHSSDSAFRFVAAVIGPKHLILANDLNVANVAVRMISRKPTGGLEVLPAVKSIRSRTAERLQGDHAQLFWYINPWAEAEQAAESETLQGDLRTYFEMAQRHGLTGLKAFGGVASILPNGSFDTQTAVYAPAPTTSSLRMFDLTPAESLAFPDWISGDLQSVVLLHANVPAAFERMGLVFDDLFADGIEGTYQDVLEDLKDPEGLNVDLRRDLFPLLGPRVILIYDAPVSQTDRSFQPMCVAFEVREADRVADVIDILMEGDREASQVDIAGSTVWRIGAEGDDSGSAITVARGYAIYANDIRLVRRLLAADSRDAIERQPDFARAKQTILDRRSSDLCILMVQGRVSSTRPGASRVSQMGPNVAEWSSPLEALFAASWTADVLVGDRVPWWWALGRAPAWWSNRLKLGYLAKDGWSFLGTEVPAGER